ncbi:MAG: TetR family transcriptional regulator [Rhodocyclaceae bacterium]|nr:TetR family transcriptional regulator [Rhodocyclaceae bacterium]
MPRREEFLQAALKRFSRDGYAATSTRDICADVGIAHSAIYNYFRSKEAILLALEEPEMLRMQAGLDALLDASHDTLPGIRVRTVVRYVFDRAIKRREAWRLMGDMLRSLSPRNRAAVIRRRDRFQETVRQALDQAVAGQTPPVDTAIAVLHLFGMAEGLAGWYRKDGRLSPDEVAHRSAEFFVGALGGGI